MAANVILGIRVLPNRFQRIKIENISLESKVENLKNEAAQKINMSKQNIELSYCGLILDDDSSLSSYGIKSGVMVHVLQKKPDVAPVAVEPITETHIGQLVLAYKTFNYTPNYRTALQRLSRPEVLEKIIAATPGLADDPVAIAIIRDPELIAQLADPDTVRRISELHPSLIKAAHNIAVHVHEEATNINQSQAGTSSGYSYSLEALSDDEDMDSSNELQESQPLTRNSSFNAITAAQLAAAIANATSATYGLSSSPANSSSTPTSSGNVITPEMFSNAMQEAFASTQNVTFGSNYQNPLTPTRSIGDPFDISRQNLQPQLQQMHEMGLVNDTANVRALQTTSGDVQAAIELVLSGAFE